MRIILFISYLIFMIAMLPAQTPNDEPDPSVFIPGVKQPKEINIGEITNQIDFPDYRKETDLNFSIVFKVLIDENGCYVHHLPPKSGHPDIIKAIELYLPQIMFTPATKEGVPIKFWVTVPFFYHP